ncbi:MAG TPA: DUF2341 domain-containing protein, partial [Bacteroidia bacterium]|nr:DUF2341 domain-containing protein [Bacteroidia bacterium]
MVKNYLFKTIILLSCFLFLSPKSTAQCTYSSSQSISAATFLACSSVTINSGVTLTVTGSVTNNTTGANITVTDNGSLVFASGITLNSNGNFSVTGTGSMTVQSGGFTINSSGGFSNAVNTTIVGGITGGNSGGITNTGTLTVTGGNITLNSTGGLSNSGVVSVTGNVTIANSGPITNNGSFTVNGNVTQNSSGGFVDNGTLSVSGNYSIQNSGGLSGTGTATITGTASTTSSGTFFGTSGCTGCTLSNAGQTSFSACGFKYRRLITISHLKVSGGVDLTNFPMLVNIASDATLKSTSNGGHVSSTSGYDIIFTAADGVTSLKFQVETYVATTGQYVAWVNIPLLSASTDTYIYMYYGDASVSTDQSSTSTWNSNYSGVWHLDESPTATAPQYKDGTSHAENCTAGGSMTAANQVAGQIYNAASLNGTSNYMYASAASLPKNNASQSISFWAYYATSPGSTEEVQVILQNQPSSSSQCLGFLNSAFQNWLWGGVTEVSSGTIASAGAWHYNTYTYDGTTHSIYIDGVLKGTTTTAANTASPNYMVLGSWFMSGTSPGGNYFNGKLDEVHVLNTALSAGWITTEYNNQSSPGTFYTLAGEPNTWTGASNGNWNVNGNWSSGSVPGSGVDVIIANGTNQPSLNANPQVNSIYINNGATLTMNAKNLSVYADITNCGTLQGSTGNIILDGDANQVQTLSGTGTYNIYDLTVSNTSGLNPSVKLVQSVTVGDAYTHNTGTLDLNGLGLNITNPATSSPTNFNAGLIMTSVAGGSLTVTDNSVKARINFEGTNFGDATHGVTINCTSSDSYFDGGTFYGTVTFVKTGSGGNVSNGGCTFYGPCSFSTTVGGSRWTFGGSNPDIFYNATFAHYCTDGSNFIISRGALGTKLYGRTVIYSESSGGFFAGRSNQGSNGSAHFYGPVIVTVAKTGNVYFAESNSTTQNTSTFEDSVQINSTASSTGDLAFGTNAGYSTISLINAGRFVAGTVAGATNVYLFNVTQTGSSYTNTISSSAASGSILYLGTQGGCTFAGSTNFTFPTIQIANSTFNGTNNSFTFTGSKASNATNGNNTFASGTNTIFTNSGSNQFALGSANPDIFNGNVT